jgi:hypothetical protein
MQMPFTHVEFLELFGAYNRELWPVVALLWVVTVGALLNLGRGGPRARRILSALLVFHWAWAGAVYHIGYFRRINPAALLFGAVFLLEAILLLWRGVIRQSLMFAPSRSIWSRLGYFLIICALGYPLLGLLSGLHYPRLPTFGIPCPSALLTTGLLLLAPRREARLLGVIPILWAGIGGSAAFMLGIRGDLLLLLGAVMLLIYLFAPARAAFHPPDQPELAAHRP